MLHLEIFHSVVLCGLGTLMQQLCRPYNRCTIVAFLQYRIVLNATNMLQPCRPDNQCFIITFSTPSHCATCDLDAAIVLPLQPVRHPGIFYTIALSTTQTCCNRLVLTTNAPPCHSKFVFLRNLKANPYSHYITLQHKTHPIVSP